MSQLSFHPFNILFFRNLGNFSKTNIIKGFFGALFFSLFIYLDFFGLENRAFNTLFALIGLFMLIYLDKKSIFWYGFFIGLFWFWWISISFIYYELSFMIPLVVLFFALLYGVLFYVSTIFDRWNIRFLALFLLSFFEPLGFNWFKMELIFINTYFSADKFTLFASLFLAYVAINIPKKRYAFLLLLPLVFFIDLKDYEKELPQLNIKLANINITQDKKWDKENLSNIIQTNLNEIKSAIDDGYDLVVLPEVAFPMVLNKNTLLMQRLEELSFDIKIITGGLYYDGEISNNSTFFFDNGKVQIANKVVLVPFGEAIPLPKVLVDFINDTFYGGASDFVPADKPSDFEINGIKFRNAICYEATSSEIYKDSPPYVIAISNNAWFTPSIEPNLQKLLMKYYSRKYKSVIYSVANNSSNEIIFN
ncbi:apolipoprotein N-acyltransferase [Arcobacter sp. FWKO B]|uniref:apolipoprotein N-acyltransferase n=1 Tax=Arcobacter sp. FWKO B TaxID=2593672 RepID=UPI0018A3A0EF|nr:apolipoprotein N-acyltransferase [Arcobacter sp. FWKO B]QOG12102.1 apolipoprotein N-acyltransferase [Arcobacter sp. FWKO B]